MARVGGERGGANLVDGEGVDGRWTVDEKGTRGEGVEGRGKNIGTLGRDWE